jgi:hypothetical protein
MAAAGAPVPVMDRAVEGVRDSPRGFGCFDLDHRYFANSAA